MKGVKGEMFKKVLGNKKVVIGVLILLVVTVVLILLKGVLSQERGKEEMPAEPDKKGIVSEAEPGNFSVEEESSNVTSVTYTDMPENTPEEAITKFLTMIKNNDFDLAYSMVYLPSGDNDFIRTDDFEWYIMKSPVGRLKDDDTMVKEMEVSLDGEIRDAEITLDIGGVSTDFKLQVALDTDNKWKMKLLDLYCYDWLLDVPTGLLVTYNDVDIAKYIDVETDNLTTYKIPVIAQRDYDLKVQSLFGESLVTINPSKKESDKSNTLLTVTVDGNTLTDALAGTQDILNVLNDTMSKGAEMKEIAGVVDYRVVMNNLSEVYNTGVRQRERYRASGGTSVSKVIKNPDVSAYLYGWDKIYLPIGIYMNMDDSSRGPIEMRLYTSIIVSNTEDTWKYFDGDSKLFTYVNGNTKNF